jgi:hypothetical protein
VAVTYKVDTDAIAPKVKQEFTAKEKAKPTASGEVKNRKAGSTTPWSREAPRSFRLL